MEQIVELDSESILRLVMLIVALVLIFAGVAAMVAFWPKRKIRAESECACLQYLGDNPDCPVHTRLAAYLRSEHERPNYTRDPKAPTHFERELGEQIKTWRTKPHSRTPCNTAATHDYLRRRSKAN